MMARSLERERDREERRRKRLPAHPRPALKRSAVFDAEIAAGSLERALDGLECAPIDVVAAMLESWAYDVLGDQRRDLLAASRLVWGVGAAVRAGAQGPRAAHADEGQLSLPTGSDPHTCAVQSTKMRCT
jgi:hypothetical protein